MSADSEQVLESAPATAAEPAPESVAPDAGAAQATERPATAINLDEADWEDIRRHPKVASRLGEFVDKRAAELAEKRANELAEQRAIALAEQRAQQIAQQQWAEWQRMQAEQERQAAKRNLPPEQYKAVDLDEQRRAYETRQTQAWAEQQAEGRWLQAVSASLPPDGQQEFYQRTRTQPFRTHQEVIDWVADWKSERKAAERVKTVEDEKYKELQAKLERQDELLRSLQRTASPSHTSSPGDPAGVTSGPTYRYADEWQGELNRKLADGEITHRQFRDLHRQYAALGLPFSYESA